MIRNGEWCPDWTAIFHAEVARWRDAQVRHAFAVFFHWRALRWATQSLRGLTFNERG